jgi:DNA invertase Pin-like site-specific DNA recombinase
MGIKTKSGGGIMKAIGYIRVSTEDQAREGISLDNQESKIKAYADLNGFELVDVIKDEGVSGKTMDRPGMNRINAMIETGEIDAVIVYKLDRLSRKTIDILSTLDAWEKKNIAFHSITDKIDTKTAAGKFLLTILSALAQMERDLISERTIDALAHKKKAGEWCGRVPFGYRIEGNRLIEDETAMKAIKKAKRLRSTGKPYRDISKSTGLSLGYVHKAINTNLRTIKASYNKHLLCAAVH